MKRRSFVWCALASCARPPASTESARRPVEQGPLDESEVAAASTDDAVERRAQVLREELAGEGLVVRVERPFVVVGDETPELVEQHSVRTVRWAVERLRAAYFDRDPAVVDIWLLGTASSYERWAKRRFGGEPSTPYGYFSHEHRALVMNIATGGGTLVHEIVHPFMAANFVDCPSWFDEGLASLYEQSTEHDGQIWGLPNWRLPGLKESIAAKELPDLPTLFATGDRPFYDDDPGSNYAHARYLCLWLQEQGLLRDFYRAFTAASAEDPGGLATFSRIVGAGDATKLAAWHRNWQRWALDLA